jgi:hypothetical protein
MRCSLFLLPMFALLVSTSVALAQAGFEMPRQVFLRRRRTKPWRAICVALYPRAACGRGGLQGGIYRIDVGSWVPAAVTTMDYVCLLLILRNHQ